MAEQLQGPFGKFVDSPYYSELELFFEVPPVTSDALLSTFHPLPKNVLQTFCHKLQKDSGTGSFESTNFPNGPRSASPILKRVFFKTNVTQTLMTEG
jgi:hypothetical protein